MYENGVFTRIVREDKRYSFYYDPRLLLLPIKKQLIRMDGHLVSSPISQWIRFSMTNTIDQIAQPRPGFMFSPDTRKLFGRS